jgi:ZIP family zinc transporter
VVDGLLMGLSISSGEATAILFTAALAPEMFLLGITAAQEFGEQRSRWKTIEIAFSIGLAIVVDDLIGTWVYSGPKSIAMAILGLGAIALWYLVTEKLLREAHEISVSPWIAVMFFAGFIPFFFAGILFRG